jgi:ketosteroid isomerase-like protein
MSSGTSGAATASQDTAAGNKRVVAEFRQIFSSGDVDRIVDCLADGATWWVAGTIPRLSGTKSKAEFREMPSGIGESTTTGAIRLTPLAWTAEGDRVAVETESCRAVFPGFTPAAGPGPAGPPSRPGTGRARSRCPPARRAAAPRSARP